MLKLKKIFSDKQDAFNMIEYFIERHLKFNDVTIDHIAKAAMVNDIMIILEDEDDTGLVMNVPAGTISVRLGLDDGTDMEFEARKDGVGTVIDCKKA